MHGVVFSELVLACFGKTSFLMKKKNAEEVKKFLRDGITVQAEMTWSLPAPDDRVEWSMWTSAIDTSAVVSAPVGLRPSPW